ncbi:LysR family transcriptional regulator [Pseudoalteromonas luteoviolacea]|uniref:HTH lysR-type domain-containing protein n=1 Tax=Pseudoalteromonas luteoviolacea DSM 6061 TaxID=1365250 RepID=A0A167CEX2_9GAMM|nr:LysR family transcriptional regulator [Pseudoalteromonas luteoviolacea]KZN47582.1 hypothetical protein N475_06790 [Pseudoalteromonas luteoviolacea DSM 6061]KZN56150.1 hypothetical protein N474_12785 [Pseudoalteromonas luteoviolacea CPMOR-2]MBE0388520.1 hypothetical protein [Pseudoalteromonas luteoviolacea DSM 6061]TQF66751.1 LysR family transcriptional regulator [Pseudoalteromonas luteoviolacea]
MNINWLDIKKLNYVVVVAEELSFSRAALRLHMSQPPLSQQIRLIENNLGMALFERSTRSVSLTAFGSLFVEKAKRVLAAHAELGECVLASQKGEGHPLKVGCISLAFEALMSDGMAVLQAQQPYLDLVIEEGSSTDLINRCDTQQLHGAIIRAHAPDLPEQDLRHLKSEKYVLACPKKWQLTMPSTSIRILSGRPFIHYPKQVQPKLHAAITQVFSDAQAQMNVVQEVKTKSTTLSLVAAGLGAAIVPQSMCSKYQQQVDFINIEEHLPSVDYYLYSKNWQAHKGLEALYGVLSNLS